MKQWLKNSRKSMAACGAVAVMLVAGWQFGVSGTEAAFSENEVALEKAIAGSGNGCYQAMRRCQGQMTAYNCISDYTAWACSQYYCKSC
ncbi:MAG: hypothetical protein JJU34_20350 [Lunatimonas sp.]|uniref:hypothetical protein n=1 Tax=Lunatimonas sp. TaxID=2060141 RepID=UPI00263B0BA8|nr:hypothetical protein [Lunatimonas sp.]MCC5939643.1 hypothetical protein [Lunatimonas sp.]